MKNRFHASNALTISAGEGYSQLWQLSTIPFISGILSSPPLHFLIFFVAFPVVASKFSIASAFQSLSKLSGLKFEVAGVPSVNPIPTVNGPKDRQAVNVQLSRLIQRACQFIRRLLSSGHVVDTMHPAGHMIHVLEELPRLGYISQRREI